MKTKHQKQQGFTLLEIIVVVAIIGILAAIAVPSYQVYTARTKIIETILFAGSAKNRIWEKHLIHSNLPEDATPAAHLIEQAMTASVYINQAIYKKIDSKSASLEITVQNIKQNTIDGKTITFIFKINPRTIIENCSGGSLSQIYRPSACRDT